MLDYLRFEGGDGQPLANVIAGCGLDPDVTTSALRALAAQGLVTQRPHHKGYTLWRVA